VYGETVTDAQTLDTMRDVKARYNMDICPHTAVGYTAARRFLRENSIDRGHISVLATAHPAKFLEVVEQATGQKPELPPQLVKVSKKQKHSIVIGNTFADLSKTLKEVLL
jgi:threonine synthase